MNAVERSAFSGARQGQASVQEVAPKEAWDILARDPHAVLVDVRSEPEWQFSGIADLASINKRPLLLSWRLYPDFAPNAAFFQSFQAHVNDTQAPVLFLCKTGGRSFDAAQAAAQAGYAHCFNVTGGFEGDANEQGQRGRINGWKAEALPWRQA